jgi:hypothetical protein
LATSIDVKVREVAIDDDFVTRSERQVPYLVNGELPHGLQAARWMTGIFQAREEERLPLSASIDRTK